MRNVNPNECKWCVVCVNGVATGMTNVNEVIACIRNKRQPNNNGRERSKRGERNERPRNEQRTTV